MDLGLGTLTKWGGVWSSAREPNREDAMTTLSKLRHFTIRGWLGFILSAIVLACGTGSRSDEAVGKNVTASVIESGRPQQRTAVVASKFSTTASLSSAPLRLQVLTNSCGANQEQDFFEVTNTGSTPIEL
jgi:hypothetical protein